MKKLLFILFLLQTTVHYAQIKVNPITLADEFAKAVNDHIDIFPKADLDLLEKTHVNSGDDWFTVWFQLSEIPVSEAFIKNNPKSGKLLKELYSICKPLNGSDNLVQGEYEAFMKELNNAMDSKENSVALQYLFMYYSSNYEME